MWQWKDSRDPPRLARRPRRAHSRETNAADASLPPPDPPGPPEDCRPRLGRSTDPRVPGEKLDAEDQCSLGRWVLTSTVPVSASLHGAFALAVPSARHALPHLHTLRHPLQGGLLQRNPTPPKTLSHRRSPSGLTSGSSAELESKCQHLGPRPGQSKMTLWGAVTLQGQGLWATLQP